MTRCMRCEYHRRRATCGGTAAALLAAPTETLDDAAFRSVGHWSTSFLKVLCVEAVCLRLDFGVPSYSTQEMYVYTHVEQVIACALVPSHDFLFFCQPENEIATSLLRADMLNKISHTTTLYCTTNKGVWVTVQLINVLNLRCRKILLDGWTRSCSAASTLNYLIKPLNTLYIPSHLIFLLVIFFRKNERNTNTDDD
jgi:hypothetical protein